MTTAFIFSASVTYLHYCHRRAARSYVEEKVKKKNPLKACISVLPRKYQKCWGAVQQAQAVGGLWADVRMASFGCGQADPHAHTLVTACASLSKQPHLCIFCLFFTCMIAKVLHHCAIHKIFPKETNCTLSIYDCKHQEKHTESHQTARKHMLVSRQKMRNK